MMKTGRSVVRVLNGANTRVRIGSDAVMSRALVAAVSTRSSVTGVLSEDLDVVRRSHQTDSLQNRRLVRSQKLRATLWKREANAYLIVIRFTNAADSRCRLAGSTRFPRTPLEGGKETSIDHDSPIFPKADDFRTEFATR